MRVKRLHHVGIAVAKLADAAAFYDGVLGLRAAGAEEVGSQGVRVAFYAAGDARVECLEPSRPDSPVGKFLNSRGPGLHHLAFEVDDIVASLAELQAKGVPLIDAAPRRGAGGNQIAFLHPKGCGGVLVELVEAPRGR